MKPTTDPATGVTTYVLSADDRKTLAAAKTIAVNVSLIERKSEYGADAWETAEGLGVILAGKGLPPLPGPGDEEDGEEPAE